jgi:hypothetical protein
MLAEEDRLFFLTGAVALMRRSTRVAYEGVIYGKGRPFAIGTTGTRPDLKKISVQEKLPVLALTNGTTANGSKAIVAWADEHKASSR